MVQEAEKAGRGPGHDIGRCCATVGVSATCRPLCTFNLDYELLTNLTSVCSQVSSEQYLPPESCVLLSTAQELARVLRCGVGGRDHLSCCRARGVNTACAPLCQGVAQHTSGTEWSR